MFDFSTAHRRRQPAPFRRYSTNDLYDDAEMTRTYGPQDPVDFAGQFRCKAVVAFGMAKNHLITLDRTTGRYRRVHRAKVIEVRKAASIFMGDEHSAAKAAA